MPNTPVPAAAKGLPETPGSDPAGFSDGKHERARAPGLFGTDSTGSRRLFLATGSAAVVFATLRQAAEASGSGAVSIHELIKRHRAAWRQFEECCGFEDRMDESDPLYAAAEAEWERLDRAEVAAMDALCAAPVKTLADGQMKAAYIDGFLHRAELTCKQKRLFVQALLGNGRRES